MLLCQCTRARLKVKRRCTIHQPLYVEGGYDLFSHHLGNDTHGSRVATGGKTGDHAHGRRVAAGRKAANNAHSRGVATGGEAVVLDLLVDLELGLVTGSEGEGSVGLLDGEHCKKRAVWLRVVEESG